MTFKTDGISSAVGRLARTVKHFLRKVFYSRVEVSEWLTKETERVP